MTKLCIDCKHYELLADYHHCSRNDLQHLDLVTGELTCDYDAGAMDCYTQRKLEFDCGVAGRFFVRKEKEA